MWVSIPPCSPASTSTSTNHHLLWCLIQMYVRFLGLNWPTIICLQKFLGSFLLPWPSGVDFPASGISFLLVPRGIDPCAPRLQYSWHSGVSPGPSCLKRSIKQNDKSKFSQLVSSHVFSCSFEVSTVKLLPLLQYKGDKCNFACGGVIFSPFSMLGVVPSVKF